MTNKEFFTEMTQKLPFYVLFNGLREVMFKELAVEPKMPVDKAPIEEKLQDAVSDGVINDVQLELYHNAVKDDDPMRIYFVNYNDIGVIYVVNMQDFNNSDPKDPIEPVIASHCHYTIPESVQEEMVEHKLSSMSMIVLVENHPLLRPVQYPKVVKHEICHAVMEHIVKDYAELAKFYYDDNNAAFIEILCDALPYISLSIKKDNGIDKFMEDAHSIFGYEDESPALLEIIEMIQDVQNNSEVTESDEGNVTVTEF